MPAKAVVGERIDVSADIFADGHDLLGARVRWRRAGRSKWRSAPHGGRRQRPLVGHPVPRPDRAARDRGRGVARPFATWRHDVEIKAAVGDDIELELEEGARILESLAPAWASATASGCSRPWPGCAGGRAACRSGSTPGSTTGWPAGGRGARRRPHGHRDPGRSGSTGPLAGVRRLVRAVPPQRGRPRRRDQAAGPAVADMGFDIVYLPPIHPIGITDRKGPTTRSGRPGRPRQPVGHRLGRGRPHRHRPRAGHARRLPPVLRRGRRASASRWRSTTRSSARPTTPG